MNSKNVILTILAVLLLGIIGGEVYVFLGQNMMFSNSDATIDSVATADSAKPKAAVKPNLTVVATRESEEKKLERQEAEQRGKIKGTYYFNARRTDYKATYETDFTRTGGLTVRKTGYHTPNGSTKWTVYVVVKDDGRVVKISPHQDPIYLGRVKMVSQTAFTLMECNSNECVGEYCDFYKNNDHHVGTLGNKGFQLYLGVVFDVAANKLYHNLSDYENRDIQASEYVKFTHSSTIESANNTEYKKEE